MYGLNLGLVSDVVIKTTLPNTRRTKNPVDPPRGPGGVERPIQTYSEEREYAPAGMLGNTT